MKKQTYKSVLLIGLLNLITFCSYTQTLDSLNTLFKQQNTNYDDRAVLLNEFSYKLQFSDPNQGLILADHVVAFKDKIKNKTLLYIAQREKANNLFQLGKLPEALESAKLALEGFLKTSDKKETSLAYGTLGVIYNHQNNYPKALENLQNSLKILEDLGDTKTANTYLNIANIYGQQGQNDKAMQYLQLANQKAIEIGDLLVQTYCLYNMSNVALSDNKHNQGLQLLDSSLVLAGKANDKMLIGRIFANKGKTFNQLQKYDSARYYLEKAILYSDSTNNERGKIVAMANLGETYLNSGQASKGYTYTKKVFEASKALKMIDLQERSAKILSEYFENLGQSDSALVYFKEHIALRDQIENEKNNNEITRLEMQYDFDLKENEYIRQQEISKLRINQLILYGILALLASLGIVGLILYRHRLRSWQLKNEIRQKEFQAVRSQMNPHFIFNVLNSIEFYVLEKDAQNASRLIQKFAKLTRLVLENSIHSQVLAHKEWETIQLYAGLESTRFQNKFEIRFEVADDLDMHTFYLPPMMVQPLLENAIHHGVRDLTDRKGIITLRIERLEKLYILISVCDNGTGIHQPYSNASTPEYKEKSIGLSAIRNRLALLKLQNPKLSKISLCLEDLKDSGSEGTCSKLILPLLNTDS